MGQTSRSRHKVREKGRWVKVKVKVKVKFTLEQAMKAQRS
jgi:hypothetical protein